MRIVRRKRRGVSLVEVMVVVAIILVLMTVLAMGVERAWRSFQVSATELTMSKTEGELVVYEARTGRRPEGRDGLQRIYGDQVPVDGWKRALIYEPPSPDQTDLVSHGSDGREGGTGYAADIRWSEVR